MASPRTIGPYFEGSVEFDRLKLELNARQCPRCKSRLYPNRRCSRCKWQWEFYAIGDGRGFRIEAVPPKKATIPDPGRDPFSS